MAQLSDDCFAHGGRLMSTAEALDLLAEKAVAVTEPETLPLTAALGRVLAEDIRATVPHTVICLGDSFDDLVAGTALSDDDRTLIRTLQSGRRWIWIEGNHDPAPPGLGGEHAAALTLGPLTFRHIADPQACAEISGHYHPKARLRSTSRPAFLVDAARVILPAFGTYTGGLRSSDPAFTPLMAPDALAILTGPRPLPVPMPR